MSQAGSSIARKNVSRRALLATAAAVPAVATVAALPAKAADASMPDPLVALWSEFVEQSRALHEIESKIEAVERQLAEAGIPRFTQLEILTDGSHPEVLKFSAEWEIEKYHDQFKEYCFMPAQEGGFMAAVERRRQKRLAAFRELKAKHDAAREAAGLSALSAEHEPIQDRLAELDSAIYKTPATTVAGLVAKLQFLCWYKDKTFKVGEPGFDVAAYPTAEQLAEAEELEQKDFPVSVLRCILADAKALAGKGGVA